MPQGTSVLRRRSTTSVAAWLLVVVFASVPTLSRVHDHLSPSDQTAGFRFSKNVERPHEKPAPARLIVIGAALIDSGTLAGELVGSSDVPLPHTRILVAPAPLRAPPLR